MSDRSYDADLVLWAEDQARALRDAARTASNLPIDWENVAEEIESLGKSQAHDLTSRIGIIILHLIKLQTSPATNPRAGWYDTIDEQRDEIERLLADSPSLRPRIPEIVGRELDRAKRRAQRALARHHEQSRVAIESLSYTPDQVTGDWFPAD